jgi:hypothetical protein
MVSNRSYTFRSQCIELGFKQRVGDCALVYVDPNNPERPDQRVSSDPPRRGGCRALLDSHYPGKKSMDR